MQNVQQSVAMTLRGCQILKMLLHVVQGDEANIPRLSMVAADLAKLGCAAPEQVTAIDAALQAPAVLSANAGPPSGSEQHVPSPHMSPSPMPGSTGQSANAQAEVALPRPLEASLKQGALPALEEQKGASQATLTAKRTQRTHMAKEKQNERSAESPKDKQQSAEAGAAMSAPDNGYQPALPPATESELQGRSTQGKEAITADRPPAQSPKDEGTLQGMAKRQWRTKKRAAVPASDAGGHHQEQTAKRLESMPGAVISSESALASAGEHGPRALAQVAPEQEAAGGQPLVPVSAQPNVATGWLAEQVRVLARTAAGAALPADVDGGALTGRSVAFVLLDAFHSEGECVAAGLHVGRCC